MTWAKVTTRQDERHLKFGIWSVSDLKLYEIQASGACNFIKFQARLESSRPHKSLCQQSCCQRIWNSTVLATWTKIATFCMNRKIFRILIILNNLVMLSLAYAATHFCSKDISLHEKFHHCFPPVNAHQCILVLKPVSAYVNTRGQHSKYCEFSRYSFAPLKWYSLFYKMHTIC